MSKQALSQYIRSGCERQLALNLRPDNQSFAAERQALGMPNPQSPRPGLRQVQEAGDEWQAEKLHDLTQTFGPGAIVGDPYVTPANQTRYNAVRLSDVISRAQPVRFLVEAEFEVGDAFQQALGIARLAAPPVNLQYAHVRPDIIAVLPPSTFPNAVQPAGTICPLPPGDRRPQLRVIDIKMTAQASPGYFAEVAYYSMALAGWLLDQGHDRQFVVVPDGAVWPGSHEASRLFLVSRQIVKQQPPDAVPPGLDTLHGQLHAAGLTAERARLIVALEEDLEPTPFEVFALRVRRFFQVELPRVLGAPWRDLEWHVDNRCSFCEYLGEERGANAQGRARPHDDHCLPTARRLDHLSQVAFISQGARLSLTQQQVTTVTALAQRQPADTVFDDHQALRATRTVVTRRAAVLPDGPAALAPQSGTSASMPRWSDLHVYLEADFDIGSAITVAFGLKAFWYEPRPYQGSPLTSPRRNQAWQATVLIVDERDLAVERRELLAFLKQIHDILVWCQRQDDQTMALPALAALTPQRRIDYRTKVQFYLWDTLQYEHLARVVGRHLQAILQNQDLSYLAWLFPPEELLPNPDMATRRSPITVVRDVVRSQLAAPVAHYYSLIEVARAYHDQRTAQYVAQQRAANPAYVPFAVNPLFGTPLSDQIPSERAHEIWSRVTTPRHWQQQMSTYQRTVGIRLDALNAVTRRLEEDLGNLLSYSAPVIEIGPAQRPARLSVDGQLWHAFARLNEAIEELDVHQARAMPPHERAARFRSARLPRRLLGDAERRALTHLGLQPRAGRRVYEVEPGSREVKAKVGDFGFALAPEAASGFLDRRVAGLVRGTPLEAAFQARLGNRYWSALVEDITGATVVGLDRNLGLIAIDPDPRYTTVFDDLHNAGLADFDRDVILDPVHHDYFTAKLLAALQAVGNPPLARSNTMVPVVQRATGQGGRGARQTAHTPPADFLWNAQAMAASPVARALAPVRARLSAHGLDLNPTQWQAWQDALTHRAWLTWGPPGTGKSRTARAIVVGAVLEAQQAGRPLRVLVTAFTYKAIDNVLLGEDGRHGIAGDLHGLLGAACRVYRVRSRYEAAPANIGQAVDVELNRHSPTRLVRQLRDDLEHARGLLVVGAPPQQAHNLLTCDDGDAQAEWFDLILIDEASQMDVAHAVLPLCGAAAGGAVVLAGDPRQLPPIHQAEAPTGLEHLVGPVYSFFEHQHHVPFSALGVNYRSNDTIVEFARQSGYLGTLVSHSPQMRVDLLTPLPVAQPPGWPASLHWTAEWNALLDPGQPATCFVYDDGRSSQRNAFEADAVAAMLWLLSGRMADQLRDERHPRTGAVIPPSTTPYSAQDFWEKAVGVVTPHRAQQGLIVQRLIDVFGATGALAEAIRGAVDTVERFQGQQRDVMVASFALGDPDQIAEEEEFLMSLNRFNVMASRARAKLIVLISREVVDHLAGEIDVLRESRLLKVFVESFCDQGRPMTLGYLRGGQVQPVPGLIRWRV
jgi:hypothetical protein